MPFLVYFDPVGNISYKQVYTDGMGPSISAFKYLIVSFTFFFNNTIPMVSQL